ncbi:hypothetical protein AMTR_s01592p00005990, partial [Amborella trichopoda]
EGEFVPDGLLQDHEVSSEEASLTSELALVEMEASSPLSVIHQEERPLLLCFSSFARTQAEVPSSPPSQAFPPAPVKTADLSQRLLHKIILLWLLFSMPLPRRLR